MSESHSIDAGFDFLSDDDNDRLARGLFGYEALQKRTHRWNRAMEREAGSRASCATISVLFYSSLALIDLICDRSDMRDSGANGSLQHKRRQFCILAFDTGRWNRDQPGRSGHGKAALSPLRSEKGF